MRRLIFASSVVALAGCYEGGDDAPSAERVASVGSCNDLGYIGTCVEDVSLWYEDGACRVRDCESEGRTCGWISNAIGWGCLGGGGGSTTFDCDDVGYEGECLSGDVLVWAENTSCRWAYCGALGKSCGWTDAVGYDCIGETTDGVLTVTEIVGGYDYTLSQDYGPTTFDGGYSYCQAYGSWGGQLVHCGVDVSLPYGTPLFVPGDGVVLVSGETPYYEDLYNPAAGELRIELAHDGAQVILGHMTQIDLWTGQPVSAGQAAGLSGTMNGGHVHLEVRVPDSSYASGMRTVDPMIYFGW